MRQKADDCKTILTSEPTTSDEEMSKDFFGVDVGEKPVGQDIGQDVTGPCVMSMPAPTPDNQNMFAHVEVTMKVNVHKGKENQNVLECPVM